MNDPFDQQNASNDRPNAWARRRRRGTGTLFASGEPAVWLTGGALVVCTLMVIALLLLVLRQGMLTFWPQAVVEVETLDRQVYMGEITRTDAYQPSGDTIEARTPEIATRARAELAEDGNTTRRLVRTGNFRLTQNHFAWVDDFAVSSRQEPEWALVVERLEWGRFYGFPERFVRLHPLNGVSPADVASALGNGLGADRTLALAVSASGDPGYTLAPLDSLRDKAPSGIDPANLSVIAEGTAPAAVIAIAEVAEGAEAAWSAFSTHHQEARARWRARRALEKDDTGAVNHRQEKARLALRSAEIERDTAAEEDPGSASAVRAQAAFDAAETEYREIRAWADEAFADIRVEIDRINEENARYRLVMRTAGEGSAAPQTTALRLDDIVRAYPANQLSTAGKLGIYVSRWWEFLTDEPREANSEGGVFPAIFGTVAMTLIMSLAVVPFGVLAALYLREYAKGGAVVSAVRIAVNNLAGVPSIVFGVFGLGFFCYVVGASLDELLFAAHLPNPTFGKGGLLWASLTLALLTLPVVIVATEEAVAAVPSSMREGSYACGASKWQTILRIVLPRAMPGIITGMVLAIARGAGEVAPLMLVGAVKLAPELPIDGIFPFLHPERSFMHLGFHIYDVGFQSQNSEAAKPMVFTTTLLLIAIIALLNLVTVWLRGHLRKKFAVGQF